MTGKVEMLEASGLAVTRSSGIRLYIPFLGVKAQGDVSPVKR